MLERDDGSLPASESATLKLDADWVMILSACNTAGAQSENAEALSGIARAFCALLSHWEMGSDARVTFTTRAFAEHEARPKVGRAEAFRVSIKELVEKDTLSATLLPQWAPFAVGEGPNG